MEEGVLPLSTILSNNPSETFMDLDYMDELLLAGCWLEAEGSEFTHFDPSNPISPFEPSFPWPLLEAGNTEPNPNPSKENQIERQRSSFPENLSISNPQSQNYSLEPSEMSKKWWIGPRASIPVMDRLIQALGYIKNWSREKDVLIQVWVPVNRGGKRVLTTNNQPFSLDLNCPRLAHYREISVNYHFPAEEDSKEVVGLPGRVFRSRVPEWTPDVRFFSRDEYPRVGHAQQYDVRGTLAVPVLEQDTHICLGVIEVVLTTQKSQYRPELESVCKALEAVQLRSSETSINRNLLTCDLSYQAALPEILEVFKSTCTTHGLPLAQTWVPCMLQGKEGCRHSDETLKICLSPVDSACYIGDSNIQGFHEACSEYHLLKGQGIVGRALKTNQPCFSPDVTAFSKSEYPLSHHARMFGLKAAVAIRLRSICTGSADFVLEFFLPMKCQDPEEQKDLLTSLSAIIQNVCRTLRVVTLRELQEESDQVENNSSVMSISKDDDHMRFLRQEKENEKMREMSSLPEFSGAEQDNQPNCNSRDDITFVTNTSTSGDGGSIYTNKTGEKKRVKAEKTITLEILRQHFAGSLKDAAKHLGVCPTTLKRICRQHGIQRWPSRKIKKVGHTLRKIQRVIDSVQGTSGALQIDSFYSNFPELASPNASRATQFSNSKSNDNNNNLKPFKNTILRPTTVSPSSSCSQSSTSSQCCSSGAQPNISCHDQEPLVMEEPGNGMMLKRTRSDANIHFLGDGGPKQNLPRSQSHILFSWPNNNTNNNSNPDNLLSPAGGQESRESDGPRIKVSYGEDTIRFRMQNHWRYRDLLHEISRRFGVDDNGVHLKYLDDDLEWVLLTCDADLEECLDVCRSSRNHTIKLAFLHDSQTMFGRSFAMRGPSSL